MIWSGVSTGTDMCTTMGKSHVGRLPLLPRLVALFIRFKSGTQSAHRTRVRGARCATTWAPSGSRGPGFLGSPVRSPGSSTQATCAGNTSMLTLCYLLFLSLLPLTQCCYVYPPDVKDPCKEKECSFGAQCVPSLDGLTARCQCPQRCDSYGDSVGSTPVCGSDGRDYPTQCEMRRAACREMKDIRVKYFGKCGEYPFLFY